MKIRGENLDKKDLFGKSDPYFVLYRKMPSGSYARVYQSGTIMKTLDPSWDPFHVRIWDICGKDLNQDIKVECYDWDRFSSDDLIGEATFTLEKITSPGANKTFELIHPKYKVSKKKYTNSGKLVVENAKLVKVPKFVEFLRGGLEINLMVAIDFTGSNGNPSYNFSLHYINPDGSDNMYMKAIRSVGSILAAYDKNQKIPVYGYGAKLPDGGLSHCFPLNGDKDKPEVDGIDGVLKAYQEALRTVKLYGPTYFAEIIKNASKIAKDEAKKNPNKYYVLLILTDGAINDMGATIDAIIEASNNSPLSIVITGIGDAYFGSMNKLDSDGRALTGSDGAIARRDIVQFVPFNRCCSSPYLLAQETLAEIPRQVSDYMVMKGLLPVNEITYIFLLSFLCFLNSLLFLWMKMDFPLTGLCLNKLPSMHFLLLRTLFPLIKQVKPLSPCLCLRCVFAPVIFSSTIPAIFFAFFIMTCLLLMR